MKNRSRNNNLWRNILGCFVVVVVLAVTAQSIISTIYTFNQNSLQRFCIVATGPKLNIATNGISIGAVSLLTSERQIGWDLQYKNLDGIPVGIQIHGPIPFGQSFGPLAVALCGVPSTLACDTSVAGQLKGIILETGPGGQPLKPIIQAIRKEPWRYYVQINTGAFPLGEIMGELNSICGSSV